MGSLVDWVKSLFPSKSKQPFTTSKESKRVDEKEAIARVVHYFGKPKAAVVRVLKGKISVGDCVRFYGHTTDFEQKIDSLQVNHRPIQEAGKGREIGVLVRIRVRPGDLVFKA